MNKKGFTILELTVVTGILTIILTAMTIALLQQQRQFNITREVSDVDQTGRVALDLISSDVRNAASRQGKTFSIEFVNGGSIGSPVCTTNTADSGTVDSPPDCITIRSWDLARGMERGAALMTSCDKNPANDGKVCLPSTVAPPNVISSGGSLVLQIPEEWIDGDTGFLIGEESSTVNGVLIGVRSRTALCNSDSTIVCSNDPDKCSECSALFSATVDSSARTATISNFSDVKDHNFPTDFSNNFQNFIDGVSVNGINYGFSPSIATQPSEMTLVTSRTYRIDPVNRELEMRSDDTNAFQPIIGGLDAPGIVDLQFVFTLQSDDGEVIRVGLPQDVPNNIFSDFTQIPAAMAKDTKDIREVEVYLVIKSKIKPQKISGGSYEQTIPPIADVLERTVTQQSASPVEPEEGFIYRIFTTTVYPRNLAREDFG